MDTVLPSKTRVEVRRRIFSKCMHIRFIRMNGSNESVLYAIVERGEN